MKVPGMKSAAQLPAKWKNCEGLLLVDVVWVVGVAVQVARRTSQSVPGELALVSFVRCWMEVKT